MKLIHRGFLPMLLATVVSSTGYAQSVATYDGTYRGVSLTASGGNKACASPAPAPGTLTIKNGAVQFASTNPSDPYVGTVTAQGDLSARRGQGGVFTGKVEAGKITGGTNYGGSCTLMFVWQKQ
jgi:hypothetical protein